MSVIIAVIIDGFLPVVRQEAFVVELDLAVLLDLVLDHGDRTGNGTLDDGAISLTTTNENQRLQKLAQALKI